MILEGVKVPGRSKGTPLPTDMTELLLKHGADPNVKDKSGKTPLHIARQYRHIRAVELLIQHGAIESRDIEGDTMIRRKPH